MKFIATVRVITVHRFEVEAEDEQRANSVAYDEVAPDLDPYADQYVESACHPVVPAEGEVESVTVP